MFVGLLNSRLDEYINKLFDRNEIVAQVNSVLRSTKIKLIFDGLSLFILELTMNFKKRKVFFQEKLERLLIKEFDLLQLLIKKITQFIQYPEIVQVVWGGIEVDIKKRINYLMHLLRKKIQKISLNFEDVIDINHFGYRIHFYQ